MNPLKVSSTGLSLVEAVNNLEHVLNGKWDYGTKYRIVSANLVGENILHQGQRLDEWSFCIVPIKERRWTNGVPGL